MSPIQYRMSTVRRSAVARVVAMAVILSTMLPLAGCRICAECEDLAYPAYGGSWQRTNRESGRVGSIFDPGGAKMSDLISRDEPDQPDEIVRELQKAKDGDRDPDEDTEDRQDEDASEETDRPRLKDFRDQRLEDIENDDDLRDRSLDDIEVRIIPGRSPKMVQSP